jgi:hypothetical protein
MVLEREQCNSATFCKKLADKEEQTRTLTNQVQQMENQLREFVQRANIGNSTIAYLEQRERELNAVVDQLNAALLACSNVSLFHIYMVDSA